MLSSLKRILPLGLALLSLGGASARPARRAIRTASDPVRGVNLGGWLVLEPWITPSLFDPLPNTVVDEYTFAASQPHDVAYAALLAHWSSFITKADISAIADAGLNTVRIPFGYWSIDISRGEPYLQGAWPFLQSAVTWALEAGLDVWIDVHGAPGSQNGFDNSGQFGQATWHTQQDNLDRHHNVIDFLVAEFSKDTYASIGPTVSIELLNEPAGFLDPAITSTYKKFAQDVYPAIRSRAPNMPVVIADAFQPIPTWTGVLDAPDYSNTILDTHTYFCFTNDLVALDMPAHLAAACKAPLSNTPTRPTIVGEWSLAMTDCAKYLNGRNRGARYDGTYLTTTVTGSCQGWSGAGDAFSADYKTFLRQYFEAQTSTFERTGGWIFWTWKTEAAAEWDYSRGLQQGWIPRQPTERQFPNVCQ